MRVVKPTRTAAVSSGSEEGRPSLGKRKHFHSASQGQRGSLPKNPKGVLLLSARYKRRRKKNEKGNAGSVSVR